MADLKDLQNDLVSVQLLAPTQKTADAYSAYVDTAGYNGVKFIVGAKATTADSSNYFTPKIYGTNSTSPGTFSNYTVCATAELNGSFAAVEDTDDYLDSVSLKQHKYRYYCIFFDETSTADAVLAASVEMSGRHQPAGDDTVTTGAVS